MFANHAGGLPGFDLPFSPHRRLAAAVLFSPCEGPRAVLMGVLAEAGLRVVVLLQAPTDVVGLADVEFPLGVLQDVHPESRLLSGLRHSVGVLEGHIG